jgi:acetolactate synthase-1/3 small subunit
MQSNWLLSLIVNNHFGVLTRVTGLFSRRGYNIASLSVGETNDPKLSRITIQTCTDSAAVSQIIKQLEKLEDVKSVALLPGAETIARELLIVKLVVSAPRRETLSETLSGFNFRIPHEDENRLVIEFTGSPAECEKLIKTIEPYTILELCRTGVTAMSIVSS